MNWSLIIGSIIIVSIIYFWAYFSKIIPKGINKIQSNMIGKIGVIKKDINPITKIGTVSIAGVIWKAKTDDAQIIKSGTRVQVVKVEGNILIVKANIVAQFDEKKGLGTSQV